MRKLLLFLLSSSFILGINAQSASEMEMARSMAREYGYSDSQINSVLNRNIGSQASKTVAVTSSPEALEISANNQATADVVDVAEQQAFEQGYVIGQSTVETSVKSSIFGHGFFASKGLAYVPNYTMQAPDNYVLGPGDELTIDIWGATTANMVVTIGNDGGITLVDLGPVYLSGMSVKTAEKRLTEQFSRMYSGLGGGSPDTFLRLGVSKIKNVNVNVVGEVNTPGVYTIPSLSTLTSAIFLAGGVTDNAGIRDIRLVRGGETVGSFDLYDFILEGKYDTGLRMQENDIIVVGSADILVKVTGEVIRPYIYELIEGESVSDLLRFAGGFTREADHTSVNILRRDGPVGSSYDVQAGNFDSWYLEDKDEVSARLEFTRTYDNNVTLAGSVMRPGNYSIGGSIIDIPSLLAASGGLLENAYPVYGRITRLDEYRQPQVETFDIRKVLDGEVESRLSRGDTVYIFSMDEIRDRRTVNISGCVNRPGEYDYVEGMTLLGLILTARGITEDAYMFRASLERIDNLGMPVLISFNVDDVLKGKEDIPLYYGDRVVVYNRNSLVDHSTVTIAGNVISPRSLTYFDGITLRDLILMAGGIQDGADLQKVEVSSRGGYGKGSIAVYNLIENPDLYDLKLKPYDIVSIKQLTYFRQEKTISVSGEVITPGTYSIDESNPRFSQILDRVGGFTTDAYLEGVKLVRRMTADDIRRKRAASTIEYMNMKDSWQDGGQVVSLDVYLDSVMSINSQDYTVGIDLQKIIEEPGSNFDVVLEAGDRIIVPRINNTVKISGSVFQPNSVVYQEHMSWKKYIRKAGGFASNAQKSKAYILYMDGNIVVRGHGMKVKPGCEIVVPEKPVEEHDKLSTTEIASIASTSASMASLVIALLRVL